MPSYVATPGTVDEVAAVVRVAAAHSLAVVGRGAGTRLAWGAAPRTCDLVVDLRRLDRIIDHAAGDMVVQVQAGVRLDRLAAVVAGAGQQLAVEPLPRPAGTVGGALAIGTGGPRSLRYGRPRDLLLGVTMVRADGAVASAGGRVVKNVAGYDLGKLLCGSYGTLGLIVAATLRLHPLPAATAWVSAGRPDPAAAHAGLTALLGSQLFPSAVELDQPAAGEPVTLTALFEGTAAGVGARAAAAARLVGGEVADGPPDWWGRLPVDPGGTLVEIVSPPAGLARIFDVVAGAARTHRIAAPVRGGAAGLHLGLPPGVEPGVVASFLAIVRSGVAPDGSAVVRHAPAGVRDAVDPWGPVHPGALALMRRVKDQFDPDHRLAPGRFVGGI
jgi:glycolate oxidase FAD binding subunit